MLRAHCIRIEPYSTLRRLYSSDNIKSSAAPAAPHGRGMYDTLPFFSHDPRTLRARCKCALSTSVPSYSVPVGRQCTSPASCVLRYVREHSLRWCVTASSSCVPACPTPRHPWRHAGETVSEHSPLASFPGRLYRPGGGDRGFREGGFSVRCRRRCRRSPHTMVRYPERKEARVHWSCFSLLRVCSVS